MGWEEVARRLPYPKKGRIRSRDVLRPVSEFGGPIPPSIFGSFFSFRGFGEFSSAFFKRISCREVHARFRIWKWDPSILLTVHIPHPHQRCADDI